jgi:hypothetical protein
MKSLKFTFAFALLLSVSLHAQDKPSEKTPDVSEFSVTTRAASVSGTLTGPDTFNRFFGMPAPDPTCNATGATLSLTGANCYYDVYQIYTPVGEDLVASITSGSDSYMLLYCDPFDPLNPLTNGRFSDDDDAGSLNAAFLPGDHVYLEPYTTYYLVVTSFDSNSSFSYTLDIDGDVVVGTPPQIPVSDWAVYFGILLIGIFTIYRFKARMA